MPISDNGDRVESKLRTVRIRDTMFCLRCDFCFIATAVMADGSRKRLLYCSRLDCDEWLLEDSSDTEDV
jgi:hypothetical protein